MRTATVSLAALLLALLLPATVSAAPCWDMASARYGVPVPLLKAVAQVESSNRARVVARNTNGSLDMGFMQVNDWWLPTLSRYGIGKDELMDGCTNLNVGAWILKQGIERYGYNWRGVGAYGAGTSAKKETARKVYADKVMAALERQAERQAPRQARRGYADGGGDGDGGARLMPAVWVRRHGAGTGGYGEGTSRYGAAGESGRYTTPIRRTDTGTAAATGHGGRQIRWGNDDGDSTATATSDGDGGG